MKFASRIYIALLCASLLVFSPGCASTADKTALNVQTVSRQSLATAWDGFRSARAQGLVTDEQWRMGAAAMDGYKRTSVAFLNTLEAYQKNKDKPALDAALITLDTSWQQLYPILVKYYPQLTKTPPPP